MQHQNSKLDYFPAVDFLRGCGAFVILIWHYHHFYFEKPYFGPTFGNPTWEFDRQPFYDFFKIFYHHGGLAVQFFWLLSGFVFAFVYFKKGLGIKDFFVFRFSRLYPLHFLSLILIASLQYFSFYLFGKFQILEINDLYHFILNIFFAQYWGFQDGYSFNSVSWSISVEELVYYSFWLFSIYFGIKNKIGILILVGLSFLLTKFFGIYAWAFFYFFVGAFIFYSQRLLSSLGNIYFSIFLLVVAALILLIRQNLDFVSSLEVYNFLIKLKPYLANVSLACGFSGLVLVAAAIDKSSCLSRFNSFFKYVGSLTYSIYMLHLPVQVLILITFDYFGFNRAIFDTKVSLIIFVILMVILGRVSYLYFESPLQRLIRNKFSTKKVA